MSTSICRYSGITLQKVAGFSDRLFLSHHPFMDLPHHEIFSILQEAERKHIEFSRLERRLLFIALLKNSSLVEFAFPALPSDSMILAKIDDLFWLCQELERFPEQKPTFPKFKVGRENSAIENFSSIFQAWLFHLQINYKPITPAFEVKKEKRAIFDKVETRPSKEQFNWVLSNLDLEDPEQYYFATKLKHPTSLEEEELRKLIFLLNEKLPTTSQPQDKNKVKIIQWLSSYLKTLQNLNAVELNFGFQIEQSQEEQDNKPQRKNFTSFLDFAKALKAWESSNEN